MILKIYGNEGWNFKDKVKNVFVKPLEVTQYNNNENRIVWDDVFISRYKLEDKTFNILQSDGFFESHNSNELKIVKISVMFESGLYNTYLVDSAVYLMSDEGKTIERIN